MSEHDGAMYDSMIKRVHRQVKSLRVMLDSLHVSQFHGEPNMLIDVFGHSFTLKSKTTEREWIRHQTSGDLDERKVCKCIDMKCMTLCYMFVHIYMYIRTHVCAHAVHTG